MAQVTHDGGDARPGSPLWKSISVDLGERLARAEFDGGFPGEMALAQEYGVSRGTMRNALRPLRESGAITAERGRRQHVIDSGSGLTYGPLHSLFASVRAAGMIQKSIVLSQGSTSNPEAAQLLGLAPEAPLFHLVRVRLADGEPLGRDEVWLPLDRASGLIGVDFSETALYKELRDRCGITLDGGTEELRADIADEEDQRDLACETGEPVLRIQRIGFHDGSPIEVRRSCIRGRRYAVTTQFGAVADDS